MQFHVRIRGIDRMARLAGHIAFDGRDFRGANLLFLRSGTRFVEKWVRQDAFTARCPSCHGERVVPERFKHRREVQEVICTGLWLVMIWCRDRQADDVSFGTVRGKHFGLGPKCYLVVHDRESRYPDNTVEHPKCNARPKIWLVLALVNLNMARHISVSQSWSDKASRTFYGLTRMCPPMQSRPDRYVSTRKTHKTFVGLGISRRSRGS